MRLAQILLSIAGALLVASAAPASAQQPDWRVGARGGMQIYGGAALDPVSADPFHGNAELSGARRVSGPLWLGAAFQRGGATGELHTLDADIDVLGLRLFGLYQLTLAGPLALVARGGPALSRVRVSLTDQVRLEGGGWVWGAFGGVGLDCVAVSHRGVVLGLSLEATYRWLPAVALSAGGTPLGELDPSGPGWLGGVVVRW